MEFQVSLSLNLSSNQGGLKSLARWGSLCQAWGIRRHPPLAAMRGNTKILEAQSPPLRRDQDNGPWGW